MALQQPTGQVLENMAVPGQQGRFGPEVNYSRLDYHPAPASLFFLGPCGTNKTEYLDRSY